MVHLFPIIVRYRYFRCNYCTLILTEHTSGSSPEVHRKLLYLVKYLHIQNWVEILYNSAFKETTWWIHYNYFELNIYDFIRNFFMIIDIKYDMSSGHCHILDLLRLTLERQYHQIWHTEANEINYFWLFLILVCHKTKKNIDLNPRP